MLLKGSCHCKSVQFEVESAHPYPFNYCYCSICRKTAGGGGYAINLGASYESLKVDGQQDTAVYHTFVDDQKTLPDRIFCKHCGSALWVYDERWPELVHPFASAIDTELPKPPERTHLMLDSKATWVEVEAREHDQCFAEYPDESIARWHDRLNLTEEF